MMFYSNDNKKKPGNMLNFVRVENAEVCSVEVGSVTEIK